MSAVINRAEPDRFDLAEQHRRVFFHTAQSGVSVEELGQEEYWSKVAMRVQPLDRIEVVNDDGDFFCELIVLSTGAEGLRLAPLRGVELHRAVGARGTAQRTDIRAIYKGPHLKWCAVRGDEVLHEGSKTEAACLTWISAHNASGAK